MNAIVLSFCLICAVYANPIFFSVVLEPHELQVNSTESLSVSQSSENDTSELQSSEENISNQSSESESSESSESKDNTSEESNSDSVESDEQTDLLVETRDDSMGSEENIRKSWVRVFATVVRGLSAEDNSTEVKGQPEFMSNKMTDKQPTQASTVKTLKQSRKTKMALVERPTDSSASSSESADSSDSTAFTAVTADSSQSISSESNETSSEASDSAQSSESVEDSDGSDSTELGQIRVKGCVNGTQSCESEEYFFQEIGDDAQYSVDNLMVPDEDERELILRR